MFESVPSGDAIFMKWILHGWNDSECVTIFAQLLQRIATSGGKVILVESVLPDFVLHSELDGGMRAALRIDLIVLMLNTVGAKERTLQELRQLAMAAGFASVCV